MQFWEPINTWKTNKFSTTTFFQKENHEYYFVVEEHYEEYNSVRDNYLMQYLKNLILLKLLCQLLLTYKCNVSCSFVNRKLKILKFFIYFYNNIDPLCKAFDKDSLFIAAIKSSWTLVPCNTKLCIKIT